MSHTTQSRKQQLRREMRARLAALTEAGRRAISAAVWERLATLPEFAAADCLLAYVSTAREVDTHGLIRQLLAMGRQVCVPWFDPESQQYVASELRDFDSELAAGKFGILEPAPGAVRAVETGRLDALLVPGLAFDAQGNRLGRGLGYFDRLLGGSRGVKIALAGEFQVLDEVPVADTDAALDFIVTDKRVVRCARRTIR
jgi:5-formyltetrahydrofolate cyclo-ligase